MIGYEYNVISSQADQLDEDERENKGFRPFLFLSLRY